MSDAVDDFELPVDLHIAEVQTLYERLKDALQAGHGLRVKAQAVERADAAGLQLMLACVNEMALQGLSFEWQNPSHALLSSARLLGLAGELGLEAHHV